MRDYRATGTPSKAEMRALIEREVRPFCGHAPREFASADNLRLTSNVPNMTFRGQRSWSARPAKWKD